MKADRPNEEDNGSASAEHFAELLARAAVNLSDGDPQQQAQGEPHDR